jgi:hypothetical protein
MGRIKAALYQECLFRAGSFVLFEYVQRSDDSSASLIVVGRSCIAGSNARERLSIRQTSCFLGVGLPRGCD